MAEKKSTTARTAKPGSSTPANPLSKTNPSGVKPSDPRTRPYVEMPVDRPPTHTPGS